MAKAKSEETGLTVVNRSAIHVLNDPEALEDMRDAMESAIEAGVDTSNTESMFLRVKIPSGGGTTWTIPKPGGPETTDTIRGILVGVFPRGVLWPTQGDAKKGTRPVLRTDDLVTAYRVGDIPDDMIDILEQHKREDGTWDWQQLTGGTYPESPFGWGSGKNGSGKRAHDQRVLFILPENETMPYMLIVQPGSLKSITDFLKTLPSQAIPAWRCLVELTLRCSESDGGIEYSEIVPRLVGKLNREDGTAIKETYTKLLRQSMSSIEDAD